MLTNKLSLFIFHLQKDFDNVFEILITKIKPFINKYNWEGINFPSAKDY